MQGRTIPKGRTGRRGGFWKELRGGCCSKSDKKGWELKDDNPCDKGSALWIRYVTQELDFVRWFGFLAQFMNLQYWRDPVPRLL